MTDAIGVTVLGSTGSIGSQALNVIASHPGRFRVLGLAAGGSNVELLAKQVLSFRPEVVAVASEPAPDDLALLTTSADQVGAELLIGPDGPPTLSRLFPAATVLNGITGGVGLRATLAALESGATVALANKESLVVGGDLVRRAMRRPAQIVPVDSEHSAIAQALMSGTHNRGLTAANLDGRSDLLSLVLTASGGPFRGKTRSELQGVTAQAALAHPTWSMGPVVTVNSSTLMNKGLELIEAALLFDVPPDAITPVIHPQSIVHSMVTWMDGSTVAQASYPNMEVPISLGLDWPQHLPRVGVPLAWDQATQWTFEPVDHETFPALHLARLALLESATHPAVMNAANEVCVDAFLQGGLPWLGIVDTVRQVVEDHQGSDQPTLEEVFEAERNAASRAKALIRDL